jgi:hypothetical protein
MGTVGTQQETSASNDPDRLTTGLSPALWCADGAQAVARLAYDTPPADDVGVCREVVDVASTVALWATFVGAGPEEGGLNRRVGWLGCHPRIVVRLCARKNPYPHKNLTLGAKTLAELATIAFWPAERQTAADAIAAALRLAIDDPAECAEAATDALIALRRSGYLIVASATGRFPVIRPSVVRQRRAQPDQDDGDEVHVEAADN